MRLDNELLAEVNRRLDIENELEAANAKRFKSWRYSWFHQFNVLPVAKKIINCTCGEQPEHEMVQAYNVIRCDKCDRQSFSLNYDACVKHWNSINEPIRIDPLEFFVQQSEKNNE